MRSSIWRRFDPLLLLIPCALVFIGGVMIYSAYGASLAGEEPLMDNAVFRQALFALIGLGTYMVAAMVDYHFWARMWRGVYLFALVILSITLAIGEVSFGAQSWIAFQAFDVQTSELGKVLMILVLAQCLGREPAEMESLRPLLLSLALILPPALLIYLQPDFGTALILITTWMGMVFLAGVRWRHLFLLLAIGAVLAPVIWHQLEDYMRARILLFFFPDQDPSGASYNVTQALIGIGSGGLWGKGFRQGTQSQLYFLRVRHTDFIFSVLAEELGFVGAMLLILLFALLILRLVRVAMLAQDHYGRLLAAGVAVMILIQTVVNLGMNANLLPVTGLPLPLVSYGGSSLVTMLLALGVSQSVAMRRQWADSPFGESS